MIPTVPPALTLHPLMRVLRTILQILAAVAIVVPSAVALLALVGIEVDGAALVALVAAAVLVVTTLMNALESTGLIPTLGATNPHVLPAQIGEPVPGAPLFTVGEVRDIIGSEHTGGTGTAHGRLWEAVRQAKGIDR